MSYSCFFLDLEFYQQQNNDLVQVPIVFGGANYRELLPPGSFINALQFPSPKGEYYGHYSSFARRNKNDMAQ